MFHSTTEEQYTLVVSCLISGTGPVELTKSIGFLLVDDGTGVIECIQRSQPLKNIPEPGKTPIFAPEFPPPLATVGECVSITGRASKTKSNEWQIQITGIGVSPPVQCLQAILTEFSRTLHI